MHQAKSRKILLYFFLFLILGTVNNLYLNKLKLPKIEKIEIIGLDEQENDKILKDLNSLYFQSLFFLNTIKIENILLSHSMIESFSIFRKFPSTLKINIKRTRILANRNVNGLNFLIGSNGKLINSKKQMNDVPLVFGNFDNKEFLKIKKIIDKTKLVYGNIDSIYYFGSKRWDIKMKNGILIKLPNKEVLSALKLAVDLLSSKKFEDIRIIDTRIDKQIILNEQ